MRARNRVMRTHFEQAGAIEQAVQRSARHGCRGRDDRVGASACRNIADDGRDRAARIDNESGQGAGVHVYRRDAPAATGEQFGRFRPMPEPAPVMRIVLGDDGLGSSATLHSRASNADRRDEGS